MTQQFGAGIPMLLQQRHDVLFDIGRSPRLPKAHDLLAAGHLAERTTHEDDFVAVAARQMRQQRGDDLHRLACSLLDQAWVVRQPLDFRPLEVTALVVGVGCAFVIGQNGMSACLEHLHHERGAAARQAGDDDDVVRLKLGCEFLLGDGR